MEHQKFKAWVRGYGVNRLADTLGVHRTTVSRWINGSMVPSDGQRLAILHLAGRKLKLGDIVDGY